LLTGDHDSGSTALELLEVPRLSSARSVLLKERMQYGRMNPAR
jgi:hypothetical protein